jgi:hypothetical protein
MATTSHLFIDQGSDYSSIVTVLSATNSPLNLTGYVAKSQLRKSYGSSVSYNITCTIQNAALGRVRLALTAAQTEAIPHGRWLYDVEITETATGKKKRVVEGIATITPQITQI